MLRDFWHDKIRSFVTAITALTHNCQIGRVDYSWQNFCSDDMQWNGRLSFCYVNKKITRPLQFLVRIFNVLRVFCAILNQPQNVFLLVRQKCIDIYVWKPGFPKILLCAWSEMWYKCLPRRLAYIFKQMTNIKENFWIKRISIPRK